jgi:hypothetical protein
MSLVVLALSHAAEPHTPAPLVQTVSGFHAASADSFRPEAALASGESGSETAVSRDTGSNPACAFLLESGTRFWLNQAVTGVRRDHPAVADTHDECKRFERVQVARDAGNSRKIELQRSRIE